MENENQTIDPEVIKNEVALTNPSIPVSVDELAALEENHGVAIVEQRHKIVDALRRASISLTNPQDWLLFRAEDRVTAYLQDSGAQRIMPLWGIEITPKNGFKETRVSDDINADYAVTCYGDAFCNVTNIALKDIEGTRYSDEDFCKDLAPVRKKIRVQQAAVANRNGNAVRKLAGLSNVAIEFIEEVWKGTTKSTALCALGKGYGSRLERQGGQAKDATPTDIKPPICDICGKIMKYVSGTDRYPAFWSCPDKKKGPDGKYNNHGSVDASKWASTMAAAAKDQQRESGMEG